MAYLPHYLLTGAETVIGTLREIKREIKSACSERFFTTLYTLLGNEQRILDAYSEALRVKREYHTEIRGWGAFYFPGDWN